MVVMQSRSLRSLRGSSALAALKSTLLRVVNDHVGPVGILGVVQKTTNVVNKQWVEQVSDLLLVGEVKRSFVWDPYTLQMHRADFHDMADFFAFQNTIAATSSHTSNI